MKWWAVESKRVVGVAGFRWSRGPPLDCDVSTSKHVGKTIYIFSLLWFERPSLVELLPSQENSRHVFQQICQETSQLAPFGLEGFTHFVET